MAQDNTSVTQSLVGSLAPGTLLHEYRIEGVLGHGGFGITYLARDTHLDKKVAIKEYLPNDLAARAPDQTVTIRSPETSEAFKWGLQNFIKEARVLAKFSHPSLVQVHRYFEANQTAYFVMEYAEGTTLANVLKHEGPLPEVRLRKILFPLLNGLEEVHRLGVLHRDIKPDNIILREGAGPVLIDFGAARQNLTGMTRSVMSVLTAGYAPIEQYATGGNQGAWTDLYALGAVAYRALSGKKPIDAINRIRDDPMVPASMLGQGKYSEAFLKAVDWALAVNPEDRPATIADFKAALDGMRAPPAPARPHTGRDLTPVARPRAALDDGLTEISNPTDKTEITGGRPLDLGTRLPVWPKLAGLGAVVVLGAIVGAAVFLRPKVPAPVPAPTATPGPRTQAPTETAKAPAPAPAAVDPVAPAPTPAPAAPETAPGETAAPKAAEPKVPEAKTSESRAAKPAAKKPAPATATAPPAAATGRRTPVAEMPPLAVFQDCPKCPLLVPIPVGSYQMGAQPIDNGNTWEGPAHTVKLTKPFAIGRHEVTVAEWQACVAAKACPAARPGPASGEAGKAPVVNVSWSDAQAYTAWLSKATGRRYRLPTESEWEFAIRARTGSSRYWGSDRRLQCRYGNGADQAALKRDNKLMAVECNDGFAALAPVGAFEPNAFGLFDMAGNAWEWVQDCWRDSYKGAPADGSALEVAACTDRVIRGGSWRARPNSLRSFGRGSSPATARSEDLGLRVVAE